MPPPFAGGPYFWRHAICQFDFAAGKMFLRLAGGFGERRIASADSSIKKFPLRGINESPPYLHDDRLLTLKDTVEFFNLILATRLTTEEKCDVVAFLRCL